MKIAVATVDGKSVSQHFGQSTGFIIFEIEDKAVRDRQWKALAETPHAQGLCHSDQGERGHFSNLSELLAGCGVVLCGGMGAGAAQALGRMGIEALVSASAFADDAVADYLRGTLTRSSASLCNCHH